MSGRTFLRSMPHEAPRAYQSIEALLMHACEHARNRLLHACEAISWIGGLASSWPHGYTPVISIKGAKLQDATAGVGEQAAHILAGQILIDGSPPWALAGGTAVKVAWLARFMVTSAVPTAFNVADSAAEKAGLKEAFRRACEDAWLRAAKGQADLIATYEQFLEDADRAFQKAEAGKQLRRTSAETNGKAKAGDDRFVEGLILRVYRLHSITAEEANRIFPLPAPPSRSQSRTR